MGPLQYMGKVISLCCNAGLELLRIPVSVAGIPPFKASVRRLGLEKRGKLWCPRELAYLGLCRDVLMSPRGGPKDLRISYMDMHVGYENQKQGV